MSTRATIKFSDGRDAFYVYRHWDGYPETILPELEFLVNQVSKHEKRFDLEYVVTRFLVNQHDYWSKHKIPLEDYIPYVITYDFHGDESYLYYCNLITTDVGVNEHGNVIKDYKWEFGTLED